MRRLRPPLLFLALILLLPGTWIVVASTMAKPDFDETYHTVGDLRKQLDELAASSPVFLRTFRLPTCVWRIFAADCIILQLRLAGWPIRDGMRS